jgi:hypothetical protein
MRNTIMNTLTTTDRHDLHLPTESVALPGIAPRVSALDRAALHLGVALIRWGRRTANPAHERRANRVELALLQRDQRLARASLATQDAVVDITSRLAPLR